MNKTRSIKMRISMVLAALVFAGFTILTVIVFLPMQDKAKADAEHSLIDIAGNAQHLVRQAIDFPTAFLKNNAADIALYAGTGIIDREEFVSHLHSLVEEYPYISSFWFIFNPGAFDDAGAFYAGTDYGDDIDGTAFAGIIYGRYVRDYWQNIALAEYDIYNDQVYLEALEIGQMYLKEPYTEVVTDQGIDKHVLTVCAPVYDADGEVLGVVGCDMYLDFFEELLSDIQIFETGYIVLTDDNGTIFYSPDPGHLMKTKEDAGLNYPYSTWQGIFGNVTSALNGKESLAYTIPVRFNLISGTHYLLSVVAPFSEINADANRILMTLVIGAICAAVIIPALIFMLVMRAMRPLSNITQALSEFSDGNLDARITGDYNNEYKPIKDAFNSMAASMKTYLDDKLQAERRAHESSLAVARVEAAREAVMTGIEYAGKIQRNLLPPDSEMSAAFSDYSVIWKPRDIVGGDIYWLKCFDKGSVLCVADCTGHGTPGALLTMLVTSSLESIVRENNCDDTASIILQLDKKMSDVLHVDSEPQSKRSILDIDDGCDIAVLFIAKDGTVTFSSANIPVFVCDGTTVTQHKGQKIFVGEGNLGVKDDVHTVTVPANPANKFYVSSDGLYDQIGMRTAGSDANESPHGRHFGYDMFRQIILENHDKNLDVITINIYNAYERYRGSEAQRDDFELVAFQP